MWLFWTQLDILVGLQLAICQIELLLNVTGLSHICGGQQSIGLSGKMLVGSAEISL